MANTPLDRVQQLDPARRRIAFVPPRFGHDLGGGAEALVADLAHLLHAAGDCDVEIWTTCARDHRSWENFYPPGASVEGGLTVRRFPVDQRDLEKFIGAEIKLAEGRTLSIEEQLVWLENSVNSTGLYRHIAEAGDSFDWILFAPYLFATTFWGGLIHPERSVLIPCLHDEAYAYLPLFSHLAAQVGRIIFNAEPELELAHRLYPQASIKAKGRVVGMSFPDSAAEDPVTGAVELPPGLEPQSYLLYSGRKERGKNLDLAIEYFTALQERRRKSGSDGKKLSLVLIGSGSIDFLSALPPGVIDLGFVGHSLKIKLMSNSLALVQPSTNESFSIVLMESWLSGRPVLVNGHCPVTRHHVMQSGGGLYFNDSDEFAAVVEALQVTPNLSDQLGGWGRRYVQTEYSPAAVLDRLLTALNIGNSGIGNSDTGNSADSAGFRPSPPHLKSTEV